MFMIQRLCVTFAIGLLSFSAFAQELSSAGFQKRFKLVKNDQGETIAIRLKSVSMRFSLKPFLQQIKNDLVREQNRLKNLGFVDHETEVDQQLLAMGLDPYAKGDGAEEVRVVKESLLNIPNIDVDASFNAIERSGLMAEFQDRVQNALLQLDLSVVANLNDERYFYRRNVIYSVVSWALEQAKKRFSSVPLLNLASFVIVKVHNLLHEQRMFHHNMMLHYFENIPESALGMTKDEVDRAVSSIFEYRIGTTGLSESNRAALDWVRYGWGKFYVQERQGNTRVRNLLSPVMGQSRYLDYERVNFGFASFTTDGTRKIYNLLINQHMFSGKPALAYDYARPDKIRRDRALLNLAQVALGFIPGIPSFVKGLADNFLDSMHKEQRLMEGSLVAYFELNQNEEMVQNIYTQNINPYIVR
jgi:hypothetical protein